MSYYVFKHVRGKTLMHLWKHNQFCPCVPLDAYTERTFIIISIHIQSAKILIWNISGHILLGPALTLQGIWQGLLRQYNATKKPLAAITWYYPFGSSCNKKWCPCMLWNCRDRYRNLNVSKY